jgi:hypothetical protein
MSLDEKTDTPKRVGCEVIKKNAPGSRLQTGRKMLIKLVQNMILWTSYLLEAVDNGCIMVNLFLLQPRDFSLVPVFPNQKCLSVSF